MKEKHKKNLLELIENIREYKFKSPEDDPVAQDANVYGFKHLVKNLKFKAKRIDDSYLKDEIEKISSSFTDVYDMYEVNSDLDPILDELSDLIEEEDYTPIESKAYDVFIDENIIEELGLIESKKFDVSKLVQYCIELNSNYKTSNYLSCALLIRAIINHIPPVFGHEKFDQVVANSSRSIKEIIAPLDSNLRKIADLHTHKLISQQEPLPTYNQIDPFKANLEILLHEIASKLKSAS